MSSSGNELPADVKNKMENGFGADFSDVRIHQDSPQAVSNGATAYTQGNDVHFGTGQYAPATQHGATLLAHELTHVVQQRNGVDSDSTTRVAERKLASYCVAGGMPAPLK